METIENTTMNMPVLALRGLTIFPGCVISFDVERDISIRALEREDARTIPIIAMTANAFAEDEKEALDAGMNVHLAKPIDVELLKQVIKRYI